MASLPWTRRKRETEEAFAAFVSYRDQHPPRRIWSVRAGGLTVAHTDLAKWYSDHCWQDRIAEYDAHLDCVRLEARERALEVTVASLTSRHQSVLSELSEIVQAEASKLRERVTAGSIGALRPGELIKFVEQLIKLDRLVAGESTENVQASYDFSALNETELVQFTTLLQKATPKLTA